MNKYNSELLLRIGDRLKKLRKGNDLYQEDVAKGTGIHYSYISRIENGKKEVEVLELSKIADFFNVPITYFLIDDTTFSSENNLPKTSKKATHVGRLIRSKRKFKKMKLYEVASLLDGDMSPIRLSKIEDGEITPTQEELAKFAEILGLDIQTLKKDDIQIFENIKDLYRELGLSEDDIEVVEEHVKYKLYK